MTINYTFKDWLNASNNDRNWSERYWLCIRAINAFLESKDLPKGIFYIAKKENYFSNPEQLRQNQNLDKQKVLKNLWKVNDRLDEVKFDNSSNDDDTFFVYEDEDSSRQTLSKTYWRSIRQTALDQLARYLLGLPPEEAVQADHIRSVYESRIKIALENGIVSKDFPILSEQLIVIEKSEKAIANTFNKSDFRKKFRIRNVEVKDNWIKITFEQNRNTHSPKGEST